ncbi:MAG: NAD(+) synthase [Acidaminococcaceae bacterium]
MNIKFSLAQIEIIAGRPDLNTKRILCAIAKAKQAQVEVLLLPELAVPGYLIGDLWEQTAFINDCERYGQEIIAATTDICVLFGNVAIDRSKKNEDGRFRKYNAAFVAQNGQLIGGTATYPFFVKTALPNYREFDDSRHFYSLKQLAQELTTTPADLITPLELTIGREQLKLGVMLCEDGWVENHALNVPAILVAQGAELLCNLSCSPFTLGKNAKRQELFSAQAHSYHTPLLYCNNIGVQNNGKNIYTYDGCSCVYTNDGQVLLASNSYQEETLTLQVTRSATGLKLTALSPHSLPLAPLTAPAQIYTTLRYGVQNFLAQLGIKKMTIGVSGGIDSAVTAACYIDILGPSNVLLVNMPSKYNSSLTQNLAETMALALGANYTVMPIQTYVDATISQLTTTTIHNYTDGHTFQLKLSPLAQENIQARDRGARILAGLAAGFGGAFSCNANKTELTVGYATFYGDIAGCLAMLGDLWKYQVYQLGHYLNTHVFHKTVIPEAVFNIKPSAELSSAQTVGSGGDPLVYPYHDYLFQAFVESWSQIAPADILLWYQKGILAAKLGCPPTVIAQAFPNVEAFITDLERWWRLFCGFAVAKRLQAPPVLSISKRAYGYDRREAQLSPYFSQDYYHLKQQLLTPLSK